jgi:hypothetical protein
MPVDVVPDRFQIKELKPEDAAETNKLLHASTIRVAQRSGGLVMNLIDPSRPFVKMVFNRVQSKWEMEIEQSGRKYTSLVVFGVTKSQDLNPGANALKGDYKIRKATNGLVAEPLNAVTDSESRRYRGDIPKCWAPELSNAVARFTLELSARDAITGDAQTATESRMANFNNLLRQNLLWAHIFNGMDGKMINGVAGIPKALCKNPDDMTDLELERRTNFVANVEKSMCKLPFPGDIQPPNSSNASLHLECTTSKAYKGYVRETVEEQRAALEPFHDALENATNVKLANMSDDMIRGLFINRKFYDTTTPMAYERTVAIARLSTARERKSRDNELIFQEHRIPHITYNGAEMSLEALDYLRLYPYLGVVASFRLDTYDIPGAKISFGLALDSVDIYGAFGAPVCMLPPELQALEDIEDAEEKQARLASMYGPLPSGYSQPMLMAPNPAAEFDDLDANMLSDGECTPSPTPSVACKRKSGLDVPKPGKKAKQPKTVE